MFQRKICRAELKTPCKFKQPVVGIQPATGCFVSSGNLPGNNFNVEQVLNYRKVVTYTFGLYRAFIFALFDSEATFFSHERGYVHLQLIRTLLHGVGLFQEALDIRTFKPFDRFF